MHAARITAHPLSLLYTAAATAAVCCCNIQVQLVVTDCTFAAGSVQEAWDKYVMGTPFAASLASLEKQGHTGAAAEARALYEKLAQERGFIGRDGSFRYL
jgi:hypothetical protein